MKSRASFSRSEEYVVIYYIESLFNVSHSNAPIHSLGRNCCRRIIDLIPMLALEDLYDFSVAFHQRIFLLHTILWSPN